MKLLYLLHVPICVYSVKIKQTSNCVNTTINRNVYWIEKRYKYKIKEAYIDDIYICELYLSEAVTQEKESRNLVILNSDWGC